MRTYYNEFDPKTAAWLRELIRRGLLPYGDVDERSICDVRATDLAGYVSCHFFAGVGGWPYALRLAGWPDDRPVWTGSCPCQPFSAAGKQRGTDDERHLWPAFFRLIAECRPPVVFGEQVAGAIGHGWLDGVCADLEGEGYAVGAHVLGAHSVGAPHIRQRLYWVADAQRNGRGADEPGRGQEGRAADGWDGEVGGLADTPQRGLGADGGASWCAGHAEQREQAGGVGDPNDAGSQGRVERWDGARERSPGPPSMGQWNDSHWHLCRDGKQRRVPTEPVFQFTSDGISDIMGPGWNLFLREIEERVTRYAEKTQTRPGEVLRTLWRYYAEETLRGGAHFGGPDSICGTQVLLVALCELARNLGNIVNGAAPDLSAIQEATVRALWRHARPRASHQWGLEGPPPGESGNALHSLPSGEGTPACCEGLFDLRRQNPWPVAMPEALSAVEEVWRSVEDGGAKSGRSARFRGGVGVIIGVNGFPLAGPMPGRVVLLKGAGNAIVPPLAAEFIKAYLDVT